MKGWLFKRLFPGYYDHMRHLVSDVIRLETELAGWRVSHQYEGKMSPSEITTTTDGTSETVYVDVDKKEQS